jgi:HD-GYP domain-containing protein (c-di-GMP phosphodiesterase class II)
MGKTNESIGAMKDVFDIAKSMSSVLDVDSLLKRFSAAAEKLLDAEASLIMLLDDDKENLSYKTNTGEKGGIIQKMKLKIGQGIAGTAAREKKSLIVNAVSGDQRFIDEVDRIPGISARSVIGTPLSVEEGLIGVIEVVNKKDSNGFTEDDRNILESLASFAAVSISNARLAEDQRNFFVNVTELLISAIEAADPRLAGHSWNVAQLSTAIGRRLGLEGKEYKDLYYGALLHDIGLLNVKEGYSLSEGVITGRDRNPEHNHPRIGSEMVKNIYLLKGASTVIRSHHENFDGTGYPDSLAGENIPLGSRIVAVVEAVEEMRLGGIPNDRIRQMIKLGQETRFDPMVVGVYLKEFSEAAV